MIYFIGNYRDGSHHEYWKCVMNIPEEEVIESKKRIKRLKIVRTTDIHKKKIEYLRFTRKLNKTSYDYYLNGMLIDPLDLPAIVEKIYIRRDERHKSGKGSQINEEVIFTFLGDRILDIDFPKDLSENKSPIFNLADSVCQLIPPYRKRSELWSKRK